MAATLDRIQGYVSRVLLDIIPSCETVRLACQRWKDDLQREDLYFDEDVVVRFVKFSAQFKHYKGPLAGQYFRIEDWQLFVAANILGLKRKDTGLRKYRMCDIEVPRKNGKTFFVAILAAWFLLMDGEAGPEVYAAAVDQAQARLCYEASEVLLERSIFYPLVKKYQWGLKVPKTVGVFKPLSKDTENKDGLNIFVGICDECHAWPNTQMLDVIKTGMGARTQPMLLRISTAGIDVSVPYYQDISVFVEELKGVRPIEDDHFFMLYTPDEGDDWEDEAVWQKLNPNLGVSLTWSYMRSTYTEAKARGGSYVAAFKTKNLDFWVDAPKVWVSDEDVQDNNSAFDVSLLEGEDVYVGIDLASKSDISATALYFPRYGAVRFLFVIPEDKVSDREDRVDYRLWVEQGWVTPCPGKVLDEDWYLARLREELTPYNVRAIAFDPWGMWDLKTKFGKYEDVLIEYQQSMRYMSVPTKRLESEVLKHQMNFLDNPVIRWMFRNVVVFRDPNDNIKLNKAKSRNKIDGVVALVDAIGGWLQVTGGESTEIYADHELRVLPSLF